MSDAKNTKYVMKENVDAKKASKKLRQPKESVWTVSFDPYAIPG